MQLELEKEQEKGKVNDPNSQLTKLFQAAQAILAYKGLQLEIAEEQLNETAVGEGRLTAKKGGVCFVT